MATCTQYEMAMLALSRLTYTEMVSFAEMVYAAAPDFSPQSIAIAVAHTADVIAVSAEKAP